MSYIVKIIKFVYTYKNKILHVFMVTLEKKCKSIKLVLTDVDGVLTDGGMYYSEEGETLKKFNTRDGMGMELLLEKNIKTILITREKSKIVKTRSKKLNVFKTYLGIQQKELLLEKISKELDIPINHIAYIGDDVNDYKIMKKVGLSCAPNDAVDKIKNISDYICKLKGGEGAFREMAELILSFK